MESLFRSVGCGYSVSVDFLRLPVSDPGGDDAAVLLVVTNRS